MIRIGEQLGAIGESRASVENRHTHSIADQFRDLAIVPIHVDEGSRGIEVFVGQRKLHQQDANAFFATQIEQAIEIIDASGIEGFTPAQMHRGSQPGGTGPLLGLEAYVVDHGGEVPLATNLEVAQAISTDGRIIIGHGGLFSGGAWRVTIEPAPCPGDTNGDGVIDTADLVNVILGWDTDGSGNNSDVNGDGTVDVTDLVVVILAWGDC